MRGLRRTALVTALVCGGLAYEGAPPPAPESAVVAAPYPENGVRIQSLASRIIEYYNRAKILRDYGISDGPEIYEGMPPYTVGVTVYKGQGALSFAVQTPSTTPNAKSAEMISVAGYNNIHFRNMASLAITMLKLSGPGNKWNVYCTMSPNQNSYTPQFAGAETRERTLYAGNTAVSHDPAVASAYLAEVVDVSNDLLNAALNTKAPLPHFDPSDCVPAKD